MRKLLNISVGTCLGLTFAVFTIQILAHKQPDSESISQLRLTTCLPPCWAGIIPGSTTVDAAKTKVRAAYAAQSDLSVKDSFVSSSYVSMDIEGDGFYLYVRFNIAKLIDEKSEIVQSIVLNEGRGDSTNYSPSIADILVTFGLPKWVLIEKAGSGNEITLKYHGFDVVFDSYSNRVELTQNIFDPSFLVGNESGDIPSKSYQPWKGIGTLNRYIQSH